MVGWHQQLKGHGFGWTPGVGDGQGGLVCCGSCGCKELDMTEWLNWTELSQPFWPSKRSLENKGGGLSGKADGLGKGKRRERAWLGSGVGVAGRVREGWDVAGEELWGLRGPGTLTHVGLGPGHGGSLFCAFHDCRYVEVCDVNVSWRQRIRKSS